MFRRLGVFSGSFLFGGSCFAFYRLLPQRESNPTSVVVLTPHQALGRMALKELAHGLNIRGRWQWRLLIRPRQSTSSTGGDRIEKHHERFARCWARSIQPDPSGKLGFDFRRVPTPGKIFVVCLKVFPCVSHRASAWCAQLPAARRYLIYQSADRILANTSLESTQVICG